MNSATPIDVLDAIRRDRAVAVVRARQVADPAGLAASLAESGIRCVEFTFTIPGVLEAIEAACSAGVVGAVSCASAVQPRKRSSAP